MDKIIGGSFTVNTIEDSVTYIIEPNIPSVTIAADEDSASVTLQISLKKKIGDNKPEYYSCYVSVFLKAGSEYKDVRAYSAMSQAFTYTNTVSRDYDSIVVCMYDKKTTVHSGYLAEKEIPIYQAGNTGESAESYELSANPQSFVVDGDGTVDNTVTVHLWHKVGGTKTEITGAALTVTDNNGNVSNYKSGDTMSSMDGELLGQALTEGDAKYFIVTADSYTANPLTVYVVKNGKQGSQGEQGPKGDKGADGKTYTLKGQAVGHYSSLKDVTTPTLNAEGSYLYYLIDDEGTPVNCYHNSAWSGITTSVGDGYVVDGDLWVWSGTVWNDVGAFTGAQGEKGLSVKSLTQYYLVSPKSTGITTSDTGWSTDIPTLSSLNKYLWNYTMTTFDDDSTAVTSPIIIGVYGDKGDDSVAYSIILTAASATVTAGGMLNATVTCTVSKNTGGTTTQNNVEGTIKATVGKVTSEISAQGSGIYNFQLQNVSWNDTNTFNKARAVTLVLYVSNMEVASASVPITVTGQMGRNMYYAGTFDEVKGTSFIVTDYEAPYVWVSGTASLPLCYAYIGVNGTFNYPAAEDGYKDASNWEYMESNNRYLITQAVFSEFAKLGSAVFNKDYMYSAYVANSLLMFTGSQTQSAETYTVIASQTALSVSAGTQYNLTVQGYSTNTSVGIYFRVFYLTGYDDTDDNWSSHAVGGNAFLSTTATSSSSLSLPFVAEYSGFVKVYVYGYGVVTSVVSDCQTDKYNRISPTFINADKVNLLPVGSVAVSSTTATNVVNTPIYVTAGCYYSVTLMARVSAGTVNFGVYRSDTGGILTTSSGTPSASSTTATTVTFGFYSDNYTGYALLKFYMDSDSNTGYVENVSVTPLNPYIPTVAVNWLNGYAHFGGDRIRFNPDGSGWLGDKSITFDASGNAAFEGKVNAFGGTFRQIRVNDAFIDGVIASPFVDESVTQSWEYDSNGNVKNTTASYLHDNILYKSSATHVLPWDMSASGRLVTLCHDDSVTGSTTFTAEDGFYFYEAGLKRKTITLSRQCVLLKGYSSGDTFKGWIVVARIDLAPTHYYGRDVKCLAMGTVTGTSTGATISYTTFDSNASTLTVARTAEGVYRINIPKDWNVHEEYLFVMATGVGHCYGVNSSCKANFYQIESTFADSDGQCVSAFSIETSDDDTRNDGSFNFMIFNRSDWNTI